MTELIKITTNEQGSNVVSTQNLHITLNIFEDLENECSTNDFLEWLQMIPFKNQSEIILHLENNDLVKYFEKSTFDKVLFNMIFTSFIRKNFKSNIVCLFDVTKIEKRQYLKISENSLFKIMGIKFFWYDEWLSKINKNYLISLNDIILMQKVEDKFKEDCNTVKSNLNNVIPQNTYIMFDESLNLYKIGKSFNVDKRENTLMGQKPSIKCMLILNKDIEKELHKKYKDQRIRGEWFKLTSDDVLDLIAYYNFTKYSM